MEKTVRRQKRSGSTRLFFIFHRVAERAERTKNIRLIICAESCGMEVKAVR